MYVLIFSMLMVWFTSIKVASRGSPSIVTLVGSYAISAFAPALYLWMKATGRSVDWDPFTAVLACVGFCAIIIASFAVGSLPTMPTRDSERILHASFGLSIILWSIINRDGHVTIEKLIGAIVIVLGMCTAFC